MTNKSSKLKIIRMIFHVQNVELMILNYARNKKILRIFYVNVTVTLAKEATIV